MRKLILILTIMGLSLFLTLTPATATQLKFDPMKQLYDVGDTLDFDLVADIDVEDAIFGFGFDLSFDGGLSFISGPGDKGSFLTFNSFVVNSTYFQHNSLFPPLWEDGDTISGELLFSQPDVSGLDILLGTFYFDAPISEPIGLETIYLGAPDLNDPFLPDGLLRGDLNSFVAFMPNNPIASASPVPEPGTFLLFASGLAGFVGFRKKFRKR